MRLLCIVQGHRFRTLKEQWLPARNRDDFESLLRFDECAHCLDVRAVITHPEDYKSRFSMAGKTFHRSEAPLPAGVTA